MRPAKLTSIGLLVAGSLAALSLVSVCVSAANAGTTTDRLTFAAAVGPPWTSTRKHPGFLNIVATKLFARLGRQVDILVLPGKRALYNANAGVEDGDFFRAAGLEKTYPNLVRVPEPLWSMKFQAFSGGPDHQALEWDSLRAFSVGYVSGFSTFENHLPDDVEVTEMRDTSSLLRMLRDHRVEVILQDTAEVNWWSRRLNIQIRPLSPLVDLEPMYIYLNTRHANLAPAIAQCLKDMKRDRTLQRIARQTLGTAK